MEGKWQKWARFPCLKKTSLLVEHCLHKSKPVIPTGCQTHPQFIIIAINGFVGWKKKTHLSFLCVGKNKGSNGNAPSIFYLWAEQKNLGALSVIPLALSFLSTWKLWCQIYYQFPNSSDNHATYAWRIRFIRNRHSLFLGGKVILLGLDSQQMIRFA